MSSASAGPAHDPEPDPRRSPPSRLLPWLLLAGLLASLPWLVHPWYDPTNDGAMYILTGRSLVDGEGYSMVGQPFRIRPPGFALLIAPLLAAWRAEPFLALNVLVSVFGALATWLLFLFARLRLGDALALGVALVLWFNPGFRQLSNQPMSDVPGLTLVLACLLLERWAARRPGWRRDLLLGLAIGVSALVRTQVVLLAPAILGMRFVRRLCGAGCRSDDGQGTTEREPWGAWCGRTLALLAVVLATQLPWQWRNATTDLEPPADQTRLWSYGTAMWHEDLGDPASRRLGWDEVLARFPFRGGQLLTVLGRRLPGPIEGGTPDAAVPWVGLFLLGSVLWVGIRRREAAELYVLGFGLLVALYFSFAPRLVLPVYALALPAAAETFVDLVRGAARRVGALRAASWLARGGAAALLLFVLVHDSSPRPAWEWIERRHRQLVSITDRFAARIEPDAVLASSRPWHYAVFLDRRVYALEFVARRSQDPAELEALIDRYGIDTVLLSPVELLDREVLPYFEAVYGAQEAPLARVFRVRPRG